MLRQRVRQPRKRKRRRRKSQRQPRLLLPLRSPSLPFLLCPSVPFPSLIIFVQRQYVSVRSVHVRKYWQLSVSVLYDGNCSVRVHGRVQVSVIQAQLRHVAAAHRHPPLHTLHRPHPLIHPILLALSPNRRHCHVRRRRGSSKQRNKQN